MQAYLCDIVGSVTDHCNKAIKYHHKISCNLFTCGASCLQFVKKCNICEAQQSKMQYIYKVCSFSDNRGLVKG